MEWPDSLDKYPVYWHARIQKGYGLKTGKDYLPWKTVRGTPSLGTSGNPDGIITGRPHELMSTRELVYFYLLERLPGVIDIRERWPILHLRETMEICAKLGVKHPQKGRFPEPPMVGFMVTRSVEDKIIHEARSLEPFGDAYREEASGLLVAQHRWCSKFKIDWKKVDASGLTADLGRVLRFMRHWHQQGHKPNLEAAHAFADVFGNVYKKNVPLSELVEKCSVKLRGSYDSAESEFRYCAWVDLIKVDLGSRLAPNLPVMLRNGS